MLHIHRAERADVLVAALAELLSQPAGDPLAAELVAVPTRGMERWLSQQLSAQLGARPGYGDGVCANVLFPSPRTVLAEALAAASGVTPESDPWLPERSVWPLLEAVEEHLAEPWLSPLAAHLGTGADSPRRVRRLSVVRHLASLFDRYAAHRPEMVRAWTGAPPDSEAPAAAWQRPLWGTLRQRIGSPGPAERLEPACRRLRAGEVELRLPQRISLFGLTRLAHSELELLRALAATRAVHMFLLHPSPALWRAVAAATEPPSDRRRSHDRTAEIPRHPLLASWGRDAREMQVVLSAAELSDHHHPLERRGDTVLERIQSDIVADVPPPGEPAAGHPDRRPAMDAGDRSLQVHSCHGQARQVEVLREEILHLLAKDATLEPRDIVVMCPDIETFAPLITAVFSGGDPEPEAEPGPPLPGAELRVRLADRALRQTNPLLAVAAELLALADGRMSASQVLDLAGREPVRARFALDDEQLRRLEEWVVASGIRWGLDAAHRAPFHLSQVEEGTWRAGLDRLLLGVTMSEDGSRRFAQRLPLDDVPGEDIDLGGRLAELISRLGQAAERLTAAQPMAAWVGAIAGAVDSLTAVPPRLSWQRRELHAALDELAQAAQENPVALTLPEVRRLLADRLAGRPTRANFRTGHLTVCTLYPMRSVPHRVVCLLGLDDGAFPRKALRDGDDLLLHEPRVGEWDPRSEDRQLLLDALLAAREHLLITYAGADERSGAALPPAVPVGELLDAAEATVRGPIGGSVRDQIVVHHPLQRFDPRNFNPAARSRSFDEVALQGAAALQGPRRRRPPFVSQPLPPLERAVVELEDLVRFLRHPVKEFLRGRLRLMLGQESDEIGDSLPVELNQLERWAVGQRLLEARLQGVAGRDACLAEIARGTLPPQELGREVINQVYPQVSQILAAVQASAPEPRQADALDVQLGLADGRRLTGTVGPAHGDVLLSASYSRVRARDRLSAWARLLAATAAHPQRPWLALTVGRPPQGSGVLIARLGPLDGAAHTRQSRAGELLEQLVELYDQGLCEPLPLFAATSAAYAQAHARGEDPHDAAAQEWKSDYNRRREDQEPEHVRALGEALPFEALLQAPPRPQEAGPGWAEVERTRFGRLARRLWDPLLGHETLEARR